jgi:hypothetical protein
MRQSRPKCKIFGQVQRPAPTKACRGNPLWSPVSMKFDFDVVLRDLDPTLTKINKSLTTLNASWVLNVKVGAKQAVV